MSNLIKLPYEISAWEDRLTSVDGEGNEFDGLVDKGKECVAQYYKEKKLCVLGADSMNSPYGIVEPNLVRKTDGTSTLTFSIYNKVYDEEQKCFVENPFVKYLNNERKIKLKYYPNGELRWLDFVIKKIEESSENYKFKYTATDLFINELSKTGYNLTFDAELENNQGTVQELAGRVLEGSDWSVGDDSEIIQQTKEEALYKIEASNTFEAYDIFTDTRVSITPTKDVPIYAFYSSIFGGDPEYFQFIYNKDNKYTADEKNVIYGAGQYYCNKSALGEFIPVYYGAHKGEKYVRTQKSEYDKTLGRYVSVYDKNGTKVYGYAESEYFTPSLVTNLITNGRDITSSNGWDQDAPGSIKVDMIERDGKKHFGLEFLCGNSNIHLINSGFRDNAKTIKQISQTDKFAIRIKAFLTENRSGFKNEELAFNVTIQRQWQEEEDLKKENIRSVVTGKIQDGWYSVQNVGVWHAVTEEQFKNDTFKIFIRPVQWDPETGGETFEGNYLIEEVQLFRQYEGVGKNNDDTKVNGIILPDGHVWNADSNVISEGIAESYVKTNYYYYYPNDQLTKPEEINYIYIGDEPSPNYTPVYGANFEKIRSISKKETNRFDLLQTLSETFECWCRFDVWHHETGEIMLGRDFSLLVKSGGAQSNEKIVFLGGDSYSLEDIYVLNGNSFPEEDMFSLYTQLKFVTFHKRIGQKKNIGFRYGLNLKSISRTLDSNDIATKLIVKSNTNEFANGGSCNIALARENPSGENFVYDFSHYFKQGLMNEENLLNDLYSTNKEQGWIGLYTNLKEKNKVRDTLVSEYASCAARLPVCKSNYENAVMFLNETTDELNEKNDELADWKEKYPNDISSDNYKILAFEIERLTFQQTQAGNDRNKAADELKAIEERAKEIEDELKDIEEDTAALIAQFEQKYIRFIQEASWISEDHIDDNLYYIDAETTLHNAAQPKVSYTINVIELSQLEDYKDYTFDLGDITYVQDPDFFGYKVSDIFKTPYKEEIVITETSTFFHNPEKCTIKAQNYRSAFEDLFQRMAASTKQLQFYSGAYERAADVVDANGNIMPGCLEEAFANNAYALSNVANQSVQWNEYGITTTNTINPAEIVRITSGGIFLSGNGGEKWTTGITANGINARTITTGVLDTGKINIYNGSQKSFAWDSQGLNAYATTPDGTYQPGKFVRFNQYGLFGVEGGTKDLSSLNNIKRNSSFYLGWDGLYLNKGVITWGTEGIKAPEIEDIPNLEERLNQTGNIQEELNKFAKDYLGTVGTTLIGGQYVISPYVGGGYLHIVDGNNSVTINPKQLNSNNIPTNIFQIKSNGKEVVNIDTAGSAKFAGDLEVGGAGGFTITSAGLNFANRFKIDSNGRAAFYARSNGGGWPGVCTTDPGEHVKRIDVGGKDVDFPPMTGDFHEDGTRLRVKFTNGNSRVTNGSKTSAMALHIDYYENGEQQYEDVWYEGGIETAPLLESGDVVLFIYRKYLNNGHGAWEYISKVGSVAGEEVLTVTEDGIYIDGQGNFTGSIHAKGGDIAGWSIHSYGLTDGSSSYFYNNWDSGDKVTVGTGSNKTNWRILLGRNGTLANFGVDANGILYAAEAVLSGSFSANSGKFSINSSQVKFGNNFTIESNGDVTVTGNITAKSLTLSEGVTISQSKVEGLTNALNSKVAFGVQKSNGTYAFKVETTGQLTCTGATIEGIITAKEGGDIGGWTVTKQKLTPDEFNQYNITYTGKSLISPEVLLGRELISDPQNPNRSVDTYLYQRVYLTPIGLYVRKRNVGHEQEPYYPNKEVENSLYYASWSSIAHNF